MYFENFFLITSIFLVLYFLLNKFSFLKDNITISNHKKIGSQNKSPIMLGGLFILIIIIFFLKDIDTDTKILFSLITLLGILSDKDILPNPKIRLIFQISIILILISLEKLNINDLRIDLINNFLSYQIFNIFFTTFCLAVLLNGSNFIDGLNGLLVGYYIIIIYSILSISQSHTEINILNIEHLEVLIFSLMILFIFNFFGKVYLGDSGSYLISILVGTYLIKFYSINPNLSPFYIALILWYPAFENLFSLIRRIYKKKNVSTPDNRHLHQLIFLFLKSKKVIRVEFLNSTSSSLILLMNLPSFLIVNNFPTKSLPIVMILILNIVMYLFLYSFFIKYFKIKK